MKETNEAGQLSPPFQHFGQVIGLRRVDARDGEAVFEIAISPQHCNVHGVVHGGVILAMLDAAGLWSIGAPDGGSPKAVTVSLNCNFLSSPKQDDTIIRATGTISKQGRRIYFASVVAQSHPSGSVVATGQGVYSKVE